VRDILTAAVFVCALVLALAACSSPKATKPSAPAELPPGSINGTERLGWDQQAPDADEFRDYSWALYVDGTPVVLTSATCGELAGDGPTASCLSPLPPLQPGQHTLELGTRFTRYGTVLESARSEALVVTVVRTALTSSASAAPRTLRLDRATDRAQSDADEPFVVERVVDGLDRPSSIAWLPDGRLLVAERGGRIRLVEADRLRDEPAAVLTDADDEVEQWASVAVAPDFEQSRHVFVAYAVRSGDGPRPGRIVRFRDVGGTLGEPAVVVDDLPRTGRAPLVRFGPDGAMYVATDVVEARDAEDLGALAGKVLRFTVSGATPRDNPFGASPVFVAGLRGRHDFDWARSSGELWHLEEDAGGVFLRRSRAGGEMTVRVPGGPIAGMVFHSGASPAAWKGSLLLASPGDECLYRVSGLDYPSPKPVVERLLANRVGRIVAIASGKDGLYIATGGSGVGAVYRIRDKS
jgi:glucose/arabinose dehydrogenase